MSYPSISGVLSERGINLQTADDVALGDAIWEALQRDLGDGVAYLRKMGDQLRASGKKRILRIVASSDPIAAQLDRLLGADISRIVCEKNLGIVLGKYNCHAPIVAFDRADLQLSFREQIELQNGVLASADC